MTADVLHPEVVVAAALTRQRLEHVDDLRADLDAALESARAEDGASWWATDRDGVDHPVRVLWFHEKCAALRELLESHDGAGQAVDAEERMILMNLIKLGDFTTWWEDGENKVDLVTFFVLDGESDALANPEDDHVKGVFDPEIRGKTDRYVLRFRKPE